MSKEELDKTEHEATRVGAINTTPERTQEKVSQKILEKGEKEVAKNFKALERLKVEYVPVDFLKPNAYNPNRQTEQDFDLLIRSMEEDGFTQPILALPSGIIIDGEHRWRAAMHLGYEKVPVVFSDMGAEQMRIATLRHNRARGTEDIELTSQLLRDLEKLGALDYAKDELLLSDTEVQRLLTDTKAVDALAGKDYTKAWEYLDANSREALDEKMRMAEVEKSLGTLASKKSDPNVIKNASLAAAEKMAVYDERLRAAKNDEEEQLARDEVKFLPVRVAFSFIDTEFEFVQAVLGENPAEKLFQMCKVEFAEMVKRGEAFDEELWDKFKDEENTDVQK